MKGRIKKLQLNNIPTSLSRLILSKDKKPAVDMLVRLGQEVCASYVYYQTKNNKHCFSFSIFNGDEEYKLDEDNKLHASYIRFIKSYSYAVAKKLLRDKIQEGSYSSLHKAIKNKSILTTRELAQASSFQANLMRDACRLIQSSHSYSSTHEIYEGKELVKQATEQYSFNSELVHFCVIEELRSLELCDEVYIIARRNKEEAQTKKNYIRSKITTSYVPTKNSREEESIHF